MSTEVLEDSGPLVPVDEPCEDELTINEAVEAAEAAGLYYVMPGEAGFTRTREGDAWAYLDRRGKPLTNPKHLARIQALVIPPAWTNVWICAKPNGHIQATGRDQKGRKQYRYHPEWNQARNLTKFNRIVAFGEALPKLRSRIAEDMRGLRLSHRKVVALVICLLERTLVRVGNEEYARLNQSFGLTTLRDEHLVVEGSKISLAFTGKRGKPFEIDLRNRKLAKLVKRIQDLPGQHLFQYLDENGECCQKVTSEDVNAYLRETTGQEYSAKDFRTWGGTVTAAVELFHLGPAESEKQAEKNIVQVVKASAEVLGNTPAVCRKYYIHPGILDAYRDGALFEVMAEELETTESEDPNDLNAEERAVLQLLRERQGEA